MSVAEIIKEIEALTPKQRLEVLDRLGSLVEPEIPESFKQGMEDIRKGRTVDLKEALRTPYKDEP